MPSATNADIHKKPSIKAGEVVRFMKSEARILGIADAVMNNIKVEIGDDIRIIFFACTEVLEVIRRAVMKIATCISAFSRQDLEDIGLAVDEACTNVIQHSCDQKSQCAIQLKFIMDNDRLSIKLTDNGPRGQTFDPEALSPVDMKSYLDTSSNGGLGVHLIKKIMDRVDYSVSQGTCNCLTMVKYTYANGKR